MPELPEVETVQLSLLPHVIAKTIDSIDVLHEKIVRQSPDIPTLLSGKTFADIKRIGKLLMFHFKETDQVLCVHLKMTGQFFYIAADVQAGGGHSMAAYDHDLPHKHTRVVFHLKDGSTLYFNDMRLFAYMRLVDPNLLEEIKAEYGIEPNQPNFTLDAFKEALSGRKTNLKALLLNQSVISGLGNIYVDEVCFYAGVSPKRLVHKLKQSEIRKLYDGCQQIIAKAIDYGGTTFRYYNDANGKKGSFKEHLLVFGRQGQPCPRCSSEIVKEKWAGRGTHYCSKCQK